MTCASCAARVERKLNSLDGVTASVNYATEQAAVEYDPARVTPGTLVDAVEQVGLLRDSSRRRRRPRPTRTDGAPSPRLVVSAVLDAAGARARHGHGAAVRLLAVARARARDAGRALGRVAVPRRRLEEPPPRDGDHGHARVARDARSVGMVGRRARLPRCRRGRDDRCRSSSCPHARPASEIYLEVAAVVTTFMLAGRYVEARAKRRAGAALRGPPRAGREGRTILDADGRSTASRSTRLAGRRVRRAAGREGRHRRRRRRRGARRSTSRSSPVRASRSRWARAAGCRRDGEPRRTARRTCRRVSAPRPRSHRSPGSSTDAQTGKAPVQRLADRVSRHLRAGRDRDRPRDARLLARRAARPRRSPSRRRSQC